MTKYRILWNKSTTINLSFRNDSICSEQINMLATTQLHLSKKHQKKKKDLPLTHKPTTGYLIWKFWFFNSFKKKILWSFFYSFFVFLILIAFKPEKSGWRNIAYFHIKYPVSPENITTTQKSHHQKKKKEKKFNHLS